MKLRLPSSLIGMIIVCTAGNQIICAAPYVLDESNPLHLSATSSLESQAPDGIEANGGSIVWDDGTQNIYTYFKKTFSGEKKLTFDVGDLNVFFGDGSNGNDWINNSALNDLQITKTGQGTLTLGNTDLASGAGRIVNAMKWIVEEGVLNLAGSADGSGYGMLSGGIEVRNGATLILSGNNALGSTNAANSNGRITELTVQQGGTVTLDTTSAQSVRLGEINLNGSQIQGIAESKLHLWDSTLNVAASDTGSMIGNITDSGSSTKLYIRGTSSTIHVENGAAEYDLAIGYLSKEGSDAQLIKTGDGLMYVFDGNYNGDIQVNGGILKIQGKGKTWGIVKGSITVNAGATLALTGNDAFGFGTSAGDTVRKLTVNEGFLHVDGGNHAMQESELNFKGATITGANGAKIEPWNGTINILQSDNSTVFENTLAVNLRGSSVTINVENGSQADDLVIGKIGNGYESATTLLKRGAGTMLVKSGGTHTGAVIIEEGELKLEGSNGANSSLRGDITVQANGMLTLVGSDSIGHGNAVGGSVRVLNVNGGTIHFGGTSDQTFNDNLINLDGGKMTGIDDSYMDMWGATIRASGESRISGVKIQLRNDGSDGKVNTIEVVEGGILAVDSQIVDHTAWNPATGLVKTGEGELLLNGNNTYSLGTVIEAGRVNVGGTAGTIGTGNVQVAQSASLVISRTNDYTLTNVVSGAGRLAHVGSGTTTLGNANSYTGGTTISAGKLVTRHADALGTGDVSITGGTLRIEVPTLNIGGSLVMSGGFIEFEPRNPLGRAQGVARMTVGGDFVMGGTASVTLDMFALNDYDYIQSFSGGTFTLTDTASLAINVLWGVDETTTFNVDDFFVDFSSLDIDYSLVTITGYDTSAWTASVSNNGTITFAEAVSIPEPSSVSLIGLMAAGLLGRRRRKA